MKKLAILVSCSAFALAACGDTTDASEEATADTVEVPADEAMAEAPDPVVEEEPVAAPAEVEEPAAVDEDTAEAAADAAQETVDDALAAAEAARETMNEAGE